MFFGPLINPPILYDNEIRQRNDWVKVHRAVGYYHSLLSVRRAQTLKNSFNDKNFHENDAT